MAIQDMGSADLGMLLGFSSSSSGSSSSSSSREVMDVTAPLSTPDLHHFLDRMQALSDGKRDHVLHTLKSNRHKLLDLISKADLGLHHVEAISQDLNRFLQLVGVGHGLKSRAAHSEMEGMAFDVGRSPKSRAGDTDIDTRKGMAFDVGHRLESRADDSEIEEIAFDVGLRQLADEARGLNRQKEEKQQALMLVDIIASIYEGIKKASEAFMLGHIVEAANEMQLLREALRLPSNVEQEIEEQPSQELHISESIKAYVALRFLWIGTFSQFRSILDNLFFRAIRFDEVERELFVTSAITFEAFPSDHGVQRTTIFQAMDSLGFLETRLSKVADMFFKTIIFPILEDCLAVTIVEESPLDAHGRKVAVLRLSSSNVLQAEMSSLEVLFSKILEAVKFLRKFVLDNEHSWMKQVGRLIWPKLAQAIISQYLRKSVPAETTQLADFQKVAKVVAEFEVGLKKENFLADMGPNGDKLSEFASDVEVHFASKRRKNILAKVRHILVRFDYKLFLRNLENAFSSKSSVERYYSELFFQPEMCAVSSVANEVLIIVHEALQACLSTPWTATQFYHAARDSVLLFRAIIPVKLVGEVDNLDQVAAVYHNDCLYIAHELLGLAYQYRACLPAGVKQIFTFVDLVPLFRCMAEDALSERVDKVMSNLMRALDEGNGFRFTDENRNREIASQALDHVIHILTNIRGKWQPLLPQSVYSKVRNLMLETVVSRLTKEVLSLNDIGADETVQLRNLLAGFMERLQAFADTDDSTNEEASVDEKVGNIVSENKIEKRVASWRKLRRFSDLLDMSLIPITQAWESGDLSRCGFTSAEVQKIVKAIFTDTSLRKESLRRISSS
ncbi:hypothetical protein O6H91_18G050800 [Diphasiastrum complanatum]|uniref:Uncharacterized protein n=1 Tax=Diphasiastrum complanatum TaxID=34168 RepID=A0ACC2B0Z4_DIPCM|nr:hypothetical protein O6H91_18G050800 [Diphasiastrum complanatum]